MADDINLSIGVDAKGATSGLKSFESQAKKSVDNVQKSFNLLKGVAVAAAGVFASRAILKGFDAVVDAASRQQDAVNKLNTALKTSGEFSEAASQDIQNFASSLQATTKFGDEAILEQVALAKAFGATNDQAKQVTEAAIELSAATGKSLEEATRQVSKTLGGFAGELGEVNPAIKALTKEQLQAGEAAKILIAQYGGSAAAQIQTFSGATAQLGNTYGDLLEKFGQFIIESPFVIGAINTLSKIFAQFGAFIDANREQIDELLNAIFEFSVRGVQAIITGVQVILKVLSKLTDAILFVVNIIPGLSSAFTFVFQSIKDTITALVGAFQFLASTVERVFGVVFDKSEGEQSNVFDGISASLDDLSGGLDTFVLDVQKSNTKVEKSYTQTAAKVVDTAKKQTADQIKQAEETAKGLIAAYSGLEKEYENFGKTELEIVVETEKKKLAIIDENLKQGLVSQQAAANLRKKITEKATADVNAIEKKAADELQKILDQQQSEREAASSGLATKRKEREEQAKAEKEAFRQSVSAVTGAITTAIADGAEILSKALSGDYIDIFISGLENVITRIPEKFKGFTDRLDVLTKSLASEFPKFLEALPGTLLKVTGSLVEAFRNGVKVILENLPQILDALLESAFQILEVILEVIPKFIEAIPTIIQKLVDNLPRFITAIVKAIPGIIKAIANALPIIVRSLANALPEVIQVLADNISPIIIALVEGIVTAVPLIISALVDELILKGGIFRIAFSLIKALVLLVPSIAIGFGRGVVNVFKEAFKGIGNIFSQGIKFPKLELGPDAENFFTELNNTFKAISDTFKVIADLFKAIGDKLGGGGGAGGFVGQVINNPGKAFEELGSGGFGFAEGGLIPSGFPNDTFPARLTSGEQVIDRTDNKRLSAFLDKQEQGGEMQTVVIQLRLGENQLADAIYKLNRKGFRTA